MVALLADRLAAAGNKLRRFHARHLNYRILDLAIGQRDGIDVCMVCRQGFGFFPP
jgi:hypothetical protein